MSDLADPHQSRNATPGELLTFLCVYARLLGAALEARERCSHPRDNPVELGSVKWGRAGYDTLLWMRYQAHVEHLGPAVGGCPECVRESLVFGEGSWFALTELGEAFAAILLSRLLLPEDDGDFEDAFELLQVGRLTPRYHREERIFTWGRHILKCFRQPSANQELILSAAEELTWPFWFDDPLPGGSGNPKGRLHDTIKDLNRRQKPYLVHFKGDGSGTRVGWELH
jgi:hypothetical protein